tara:strand:- start:410 stop:1399 length:990 start_codon:yes stop_codon:yes gene_type:complete
MIIKSFEINKINLKKNKLFLLYGKNEGLKSEIINKLVTEENKVSSYEEKEILNSQSDFLENVKNKSLFDEKKFIIIKRVTDKILKLIESINFQNFEDIIIFSAENLDKKSKLRSFFEKDKDTICIPIYPDNEQTLARLTENFFNKKNIPISKLIINQIINKVSGDRKNLFNELNKIENFVKNKKKISQENIAKLINLSENYSVSELINNCLAKNKKKTINILCENNFTSEDSILITRSLLNKSKNILKLSLEYEKNKNMDLTISTARPPIFWKDKEITQKQVYEWNSKNLKILIFKINEIELNIKKNISNSINIITDFLLEQTTLITNN